MMKQRSPGLPPFSSGWFSSGLGSFRPCDATYCLVPYEQLPPLSEVGFQGTLHWLLSSDRGFQPDHDHDPPWALSPSQWKRLQTSADQLGIPLPEAFQRLMNSRQLRDRIPSCTNCYFGLSEKLVACPGSEEGFIIRFLNAAQGQIAWYLYLTAQGEHCVLAGYPLLDLVSDPESPDSQSQGITEEERRMAMSGKATLICALSFEEFLYRFWIENVLWYKLVWYKDQELLTREERRYLSYYQARQGEG